MKLTIKQSAIVMASCASLYALFRVIWCIPALSEPIASTPYIGYLPHVCILVGMIIMGFALFNSRLSLPKLSQPLLIQAIITLAILGCMTLYNCLGGSILISGLHYFYWHIDWLHAALIAWVAAWLWQYAYSNTDDYISNQAVGIIGLLMSLVSALLLVLMLVSFVRTITIGQVAGFQVTTYMSWLRPMSVIALIAAYLLGLKKQASIPEANTTSTPQIQLYSKTSQIIAQSSVYIAALFGLIAIFGNAFKWFDIYDFEDKYFISLFACVHMLWISSIIAMLLERTNKKWLRILNILAPLVINGAIVLALCLDAFIPWEVRQSINPIIREDIPLIVICLCIALPILVWMINTVVVLRANALAKQEDNNKPNPEE